MYFLSILEATVRRGAKSLNGHLPLNMIMWQIKPLNNGTLRSFRITFGFPPHEKLKNI